MVSGILIKTFIKKRNTKDCEPLISKGLKENHSTVLTAEQTSEGNANSPQLIKKQITYILPSPQRGISQRYFLTDLIQHARS